jgi:hypothetical protein
MLRTKLKENTTNNDNNGNNENINNNNSGDFTNDGKIVIDTKKKFIKIRTIQHRVLHLNKFQETATKTLPPCLYHHHSYIHAILIKI